MFKYVNIISCDRTRGIIRSVPAFVYILRCADGTLYTGYTIDLERRFKQHQNGHGGRYTRTHLPVELVYSERLRTRRAAMWREIAIKRLPRKRKRALIE